MDHRTTGRFAILRQFIADGFPYMFGNPGSSEESFLDALSDPEFASLRYVLALQEGSAVAMADAYVRASPPEQRDGDPFPWRRPALVQLHSYAGLANGLGMIYAAKRGYSPMVVLAGDAGVAYDAMDGQMAADLPAIVRPFVKSDHHGPCAWRASHPASLLRLVRRAIKTAATPPYGPVFLSLPMDVLDQPSTEEIVRTTHVASRIRPDPAVVKEAARLLAGARTPAIIIGDGIAAAGAQAELVRVAQSIGAPVWGGNDSEVNIPATHPLAAGQLGHMFGDASRRLLSFADVVLVCGTTLLPEVFPALEGPFAHGAQVIHFDDDPSEIGKTAATTIAVLGNLKLTLDGLAAALDEVHVPATREVAIERAAAWGQTHAAARKRAIDEDSATQAGPGLHLSAFAAKLAERLPQDALIFDEAITSSPVLMRYLPRDVPGRYFQTRAGMLGTGLPGTVGLKLAHPDRTVVGLCGDGGAISTIQALSTAARYGIAAKFVVVANHRYRILDDNLDEYRRRNKLDTHAPYPDSFDLRYPDLNFADLARAQGVPSLRITMDGDLEAAIVRMFDQADDPFLLELDMN